MAAVPELAANAEKITQFYWQNLIILNGRYQNFNLFQKYVIHNQNLGDFIKNFSLCHTVLYSSEDE